MRAKLGPDLPLDTLRGAGYKLRIDWNETRHPPVTVEAVRKSA